MPPRLQILAFREFGKNWTARVLEHDMAAGARTLEQAVDTVLRIAQAHVAFDQRHNRTPLSAFAPAPRLYWNAFERASERPIVAELDWSEKTRTRVVVATVEQNPAIRTSVPLRYSA
jgi:hypothetical protein